MAVQTSYEFFTDKAYEGTISNLAVPDFGTRSAEGVIGFGRAVVRGTDAEKQVILPSAVTPVFYGVASRMRNKENPNDAPGERKEYLNTESVQVVKSGYIWVITEVVTAAGDPVFYRYAAGSETDIGRFRTDADTATAAQIVGASFETAAAAGEVALIRLPARAQ